MLPSDLPILAFKKAANFRDWLLEQHRDHPGIWLRIYKKGSDTSTISYAEALDEALCFGWIDGQKKSADAYSWLQKFTRRGQRSGWSQVNTAHVERLMLAGRMHPAGIDVVQAAKADGRWGAAYAPASKAELPADFLKALSAVPEAQAFFDTLNKTNRYAIYYRLMSAKKPETRSRRIQDFVAKLERGEKFH